MSSHDGGGERAHIAPYVRGQRGYLDCVLPIRGRCAGCVIPSERSAWARQGKIELSAAIAPLGQVLAHLALFRLELPDTDVRPFSRNLMNCIYGRLFCLAHRIIKAKALACRDRTLTGTVPGEDGYLATRPIRRISSRR